MASKVARCFEVGAQHRPEVAVRQLLPNTWYPFYGHFRGLRPIQIAAAPVLVAGTSALVMAPTATGKTEALAAPLLQRALAIPPHRRSPGPWVLYVAPTRALCNDLLRRLRPPVERCGLHVDIKTGDSPGLARSGNLPELLVTTPESLDSMLCRRPVDLRHLQALVLDELHLLDQTARGDQLATLVMRLRRIAPDIHVNAASATVPNAGRVAHDFLGPGAVLVTETGGAPTQRQIDVKAVRSMPMRAIHDLLATRQSAKVLVFANRRAQVEELGAGLELLAEGRWPVFVHHGSLARSERVRVESRMRDEPTAICVATMTLEIGIDIGDIDCVALVGVPPHVSSLLQRVGRGGRRSGRARALVTIESHFEGLRFQHLLKCARQGQLFGEAIPFRPSVLAQQALSMAFQNPKRFITARALWGRLPEVGRAIWSVEDCVETLDALVAAEELRLADGGRYVPEQACVDAFEHGLLHANIEDNKGVSVFDATTGRLLGDVALGKSDWGALNAGEVVPRSLAGQRRDLTVLRDNHVVADGVDGLSDALFISSEAPRYSFGLAQDFAAFLGLSPTEVYVQSMRKGGWVIWHFLGSLWGRILPAVLDLEARGGRSGPFSGDLRAKPPRRLGSAEALEQEVDRVVASRTKRIARMLGAGSRVSDVPPQHLLRWVRQAMDPPSFARHLASLTVLEGRVPGLA